MTAVDASPSPRERLLDAARGVLADEGLPGLTLRAIARRAGVSHGAPLRHFPSLASLLAALAARGFDRLVAAVDQAVADIEAETAAAGHRTTALQRMAVAGGAYIDTALSDPGLFSLTFRPDRCDTTDPAYQSSGTKAFGQLVDLVAGAQAEGWHPGEPTRALAAAVWSSVHGTSDLLISGGLPHVLGDEMDALQATSGRLLFGAWPLPPGPPLDDRTHPGERGTP